MEENKQTQGGSAPQQSAPGTTQGAEPQPATHNRPQPPLEESVHEHPDERARRGHSGEGDRTDADDMTLHE